MNKIAFVFLVLIMLIFISGYFYLNVNYFIITGYSAKKLCGCHLLAKRSIASIKSQDLAQFPLNLVDLEIEKGQIAKSSLFGIWESRVKYDGQNCILLNDHNRPLPKSSFAKAKNIPLKEKILSSDENQILDNLSDLIFDKPGMDEKKTRALVIIHKDSLIYERYSEGFNKDTRILGWSMNKSIANALIGMLVKDGKISLNKKDLFTEWENDQRKNISLNDLLQMQSGLDWDEDYTKRADATRLLFEEYDCSSFAIDQPLEADPGTYWEYSSGTTNIISKLIRESFSNDSLYYQFPYERLFEKLGMESIQLDTDQAGNYILSSYGYATPRDWAKFGLLYLNEGVINGDTLLNKSWIDYSKRPASQSTEQIYGAHFWLNKGLAYPDVPEDMFSCNGFQGQYVFIIPSKDLVVVRMGLTNREALDMNKPLSHIIEFVE